MNYDDAMTLLFAPTKENVTDGLSLPDEDEEDDIPQQKYNGKDGQQATTAQAKKANGTSQESHE